MRGVRRKASRMGTSMSVHQPRLLYALSAFLLFATAPAFALSIKLTPTFDHPGAKIAVSGKGFAAHAVIDIYFDGTDELLATANARGKFKKHSFKVPADADPGEHWVTAVERGDGRGAQAQFLVSASWVEFNYQPRGGRSNPYGSILSTRNLDRLSKRWEVSTVGGIESAPAVVDGVVYLSSNSTLYALAADAGTTLWTADIHGAGIPEPSPAVVDGVVYIAGGGITQALDAGSGAPIWSVQNGSNRSSPTVDGGVVYIGSSDHKIYALDAATGAVLWATAMSGDIASAPAVSGGKVYVGSTGGELDALDAETGEILWSAPTGNGIFSSPAVVDGTVYAGSTDYNLYAFDANTGATRWSAYTDAPVLSSPAVANGIVYIGSRNRTLSAYDARNGAGLWAATFGDEVDSSPAVANGVVYIGSLDHNIYALDALTGAKLWSAQTGSFIEYASPTVSDGVVYIGSLDQKLYAYALDGGDNAVYARRHTEPPSFASLHPNLRLKPESTGRNP